MNEIENNIIDREEDKEVTILHKQNKQRQSKNNEQNNKKVKENNKVKVCKYPMLQETNVSGDISECAKWVAKMKPEAIPAKRTRHNNEQ